MLHSLGAAISVGLPSPIGFGNVADDVDGELRVVAQNERNVERAIVQLMCGATGALTIDARRSVAEICGDPAITAQMMRRVARQFAAPSIVSDANADLSIAALAERVLAAAPQDAMVQPTRRELASFAPAGGWADDIEHPLTPGMAGLWFLHRLSPQSSEYADPHLIRIRAPLSRRALLRAFQVLVDRHASLRTVFDHRDGVPYFRVLPNHQMEMHFHDVVGCDDDALGRRIAEAARRPFDLAAAPAFAAHLYTRAEDDHIFLLSGHHILWDYASFVTILGEFNLLYPALAEGLQPPELGPADDIRDYVAWYTDFMVREADRLTSYWSGELKGAQPYLDLPTTYPRPETLPHIGASIRFEVDEGLVARLLDLAKAVDVTLHAVLITALQVVLSRYANQASLCISSIMSGRTRPELQRVVGYLVNPVVIRGELADDQAFLDVLEKTARSAKHAFANQYFPFSRTMSLTRAPRIPGRSPFQDVVFVLQQSEGPERQELAAMVLGDEDAALSFGGLPAAACFYQDPHAQFDLSFVMSRTQAGLKGILQYSADLFSHDAMQLLLDDLIRALEWTTVDPRRRLSEMVFKGAPQAWPAPGRRRE